MSESDDAQITCRFTTKLPAQYRVPLSEIAVPAKLTRYGLSQVVNHVLDLDEELPFDFLVNGQLVRLPLDRVLLAQGISAESVLEVEYIFAVTPPRLKQEILHDDWVSAIDGSQSGQIISGCYDGMLRIWDEDGKKRGEARLHNGPISSLENVKGRSTATLLSAGKFDHVARLLQVPSDPAKLRREGVACIAVYKGHSGSIFDVANSPATEHFVSASQDKSLRLWSTSPGDVGAEMLESEIQNPRKRRKGARQSPVALTQGVEMQHSLELLGHKDAVTSTIWAESNAIYSGSMDHSVKRWDAETGTNVETLHCKNGVFDLSMSATSPSVIAIAGAAKILQLWDARQKHAESSISFKLASILQGLTSLTSHSSFICAVEWRPGSDYHVATGSMDKTSKLWDVRAPIPLSTLEGHTEQVLSLAWWEDHKLVSGSADNTIQIYHTNH